MILCLDCGNTRLKWALLRPDGHWHVQGALTLDAIAQLRDYLADQPAPEKVIGCNVAGSSIAQRIAAQINVPITWLSASAEQCGVKNGYNDPTQLGADRWAALIAARHLHDGASLVVSAGTATTIDLLEADGEFRGGLILPGLDLMRQSLAGNTAQLPLASASYTTSPQNTAAAIVSGTLEATIGAIERMFNRLNADSAEASQSAYCLLGGGAAAQLVPHLRIPVQTVDDLVLRGLACIAGAPVPLPLNQPPTVNHHHEAS